MIIKARPFPFPLLVFFGRILFWFLKRRFKKITINPIPVPDNCSFVFMSNHFSFLDGFIAGYILYTKYHKKVKLRGLYIMILEKQVQKNRWLTKFGGFSVAPGSGTVEESLSYAAEILDEPGNVLLLFPQGKIESNHVDYINIKRGIADIVPRIDKRCQLVWSSNLVDYYEGIKPSLYCYLLDCGFNTDFDFEQFKSEINAHHTQAIQQQIRHPKY